MNKNFLKIIAAFAIISAQQVHAKWYDEINVVVSEPMTWQELSQQEEIQMGGSHPVRIGTIANTQECPTATCEIYTIDREQELPKKNGKKYRAIVINDDNILPPKDAVYVGSFELQREPRPRMALFRLK